MTWRCRAISKPEVAELDDVYLYTVDDLDQVLEESRASRQQAAGEAQNIIELQAERFFEQIKALERQASLVKVRASVERARDQQLEKARQALARGDDPDAVLVMLANQLSNKFMHQPTAALKKAALEGNTRLLKAAEQLFDIDPDAQP